MNEIDQFAAALARFTPRERERVKKAVLSLRSKREVPEEVALDVAVQCVLAAGATMAKRESDKKTDPPRRVLVGARVKREFGEKCKRAAQAQGLSLYAWVCIALERALEAQWMD